MNIMKGTSTRNNRFISVVVLSAMLVLISLGQAPAYAEAEEGSRVRVIEHAMGTTEIQGTPNRVVALHQGAIDSLLALGVNPVGAVRAWRGDPWYDHWEKYMKGVTVVGGELQPNLETIVALHPDLIIGTKVRHEAIYDELSQIAPTVFTETIGETWKENFKLYTKVLNREEKGREVLDAWHARLEDFREKMGARLDTEVSIIRFRPGQVRIYVSAFPGTIIDAAGLQTPDVQEAQQDQWGMIMLASKEQIPLMDGDTLFYFADKIKGREEAANQTLKEWMNHPLARSLKAVRTDNVYAVDEVVWNLAGGMPAANLMLDDLYEHFLGVGE